MLCGFGKCQRKNRKKSVLGTFGAFLASKNLAHAVTRRIEKKIQFRKKKVRARTFVKRGRVVYFSVRALLGGRKIDFKNSRLEKKAQSCGLAILRSLPECFFPENGRNSKGEKKLGKKIGTPS